jgi:hypothetical protein
VLALEKLLHYDLAAKYWHMGVLSQTDVIKDGFYDTGAHKPGEDFKPIKFLLDRKVRNGLFRNGLSLTFDEQNE